jgi:hypothetical protein
VTTLPGSAAQRLAYHAAPMRSCPRTLFATPVLVLALLGGSVACTAGSPSGTSSTPTSTSPTESPIPSGPIDFVRGEYELDESDVVAHLSWQGGTGTLEVVNNSPDEIGAPTLSAVTQGEQVVDATVDGAAPIPSGDAVTIEVRFPESLTLPDVGLFIIGFGDISYGAMPPVLVES